MRKFPTISENIDMQASDKHSAADAPSRFHPAAQSGLQEWHRIVANNDWDALGELLTDAAAYRNPAAFEPARGKATIISILRSVFGVLEDFEYLRQFDGEATRVLEFRARVGESKLMGADFIEFDDAGKISDLMVMIRPASAVLALTDEVARRMSAPN